LGVRLFPAFALALNLTEDFFADKVRYFLRFVFRLTPTVVDKRCGGDHEVVALPAADWRG
jgi:hypothetical protein